MARSASKESCASWRNTKPEARFLASIGRADVEEVLRKELVEEAWQEVSQTDEVKRNLERLQPVIERVGF